MSKESQERRSEVVRTLIIARHPKIHEQLPPDYRWEFTRRHPYYLRFWRWANRFLESREGKFDASKLDVFDRHELFGSVQILSLIGVAFSEYPAPSIDARTNKGFESPFSNVVAAPRTCRQLALDLLLFLPDDVRRAVAAVYLRELAKETASKEGMSLIDDFVGTITKKEQAQLAAELIALKGDEPLEDRLIKCLNRLDADSLDGDCLGIMYVNYNAPLSEITKQMKFVVQKWKEEYGEPDTRRRPDKWDEYLAVWDAREGWVNGAYDGSKAKRLRDIAVETGMDPATVQSRYEAAYKFLIGEDYKPLTWLVLFGGLKVNRGKWDSWRYSKRRSESDAKNKPTPEATTGDAHSNEQLDANALQFTDEDVRDYEELLNDLKTLFAAGHGNEEVKRELELTMSVEDVERLRDRLTDTA